MPKVSNLCFLEKLLERDTGQRGDREYVLKVCLFLFCFVLFFCFFPLSAIFCVKYYF